MTLHQVAVQVKPVYAPPQLFPIGKQTITYIATDRSGNQANCSFTVTVIGEFNLLEKHNNVNKVSYLNHHIVLAMERKAEDQIHRAGTQMLIKNDRYKEKLSSKIP